MAISLKNTKAFASNGVKILVYGQAGVGKTTLIRTLPSPLILSAEGGLLSLTGADIPYIDVHSLADLAEAFKFLSGSKEAQQFESVALDSISEIGEVVLSGEKATTKDGRAAYGQMNEKMSQLIRSFRDLPGKHVYFSAKVEQSQADTGALLYAPSMPGKSLSMSLPYFFDEVLALRVTTDKDGALQRALQTASDGIWLGKDRSGRLDMWEPANLGEVIKKIGG